MNKNLKIKTKKTSLITRSLFVISIVSFFIIGCITNDHQNADEYFKNYILEDQGANLTDTSFHFTIYKADINGDFVEDKIYITTYMDNYFGYVFNGKTNLEIPQAGWVNFISKPGREMKLEFLDLTCDGKKEIIQRSVGGQFNNKIYLNILKVYQDSLTNIFSKELTHQINPEDNFSVYRPFYTNPEKCDSTLSLTSLGYQINHDIENKIEFLLSKNLKNMVLIPALKNKREYFYGYNIDLNIFEEK